MNSELQFSGLFQDLQRDPERLSNFYANPKSFLEENGIPVIEKWSAPAASQNINLPQPRVALAKNTDVSSEAYNIQVKWHWWGVDFIMNESLTKAVEDGTDLGNTMVDMISNALQVAKIIPQIEIVTLIGKAFAAAFALKKSIIQFADKKGNGVHWPVSWIQWGLMVGSIPSGLPGITAGLLVFIQPFSN